MVQEYSVPYRYETTVGAAMPLLGPLRDLRLRGERVLSLQGVLSGALSYMLHRLHEGCTFSAAVTEARALGYIESNPLEGPHATDLSRKLLVLGREAGFAFELEDLLIEPLVDLEIAEDDDLIPALQTQDAAWKKRISEAHDPNERWIMLVEANSEGGHVGLRSVPVHSPFAQLSPRQNIISIHTELQDGMLSDVIAAAIQWPR